MNQPTGGSYDWWWQRFGRAAGLPYNPPRVQEQISLGGAPRVGFGQAELVAAPSASPWTVAVVTSIVGAAAGWALEEATEALRKRRRR